MSEKKLSAMEIDAIGEILNISLGASATAISTMLNARVDITTPVVRVENRKEFAFDNLKPAVAVEITYVEGLSGKNIMLLKRKDVKVIVEMLMGMEIDDADFELNELNVSAICEVMNQMMGASATALSELFMTTVNISTPTSIEIESEEHFKNLYFHENESMVVISFKLKIEDKMESEFMNLMSIDLAKKLVSGFFVDGLSEAVIEEAQAERQAENTEEKEEVKTVVEEPPVLEQEKVSVPSPATEPEVSPQVREATPVAPQPVQMGMDPAMMNQMMQTMQMMQQQMMQMQNAQQEKKISVKKAVGAPLKGTQNPEDTDVNLDLLMNVPLEVSVEIGRTKKLVKDVLDMNKGTLVVLDKVAGDPVDLYVNGQCIARGDVVVVEDNFGIRITEILQDNFPIEGQEK